MAGAVRLRLGRNPFDDDAARGIEGSIARQAGTFRASLRVRDARGTQIGQRELQLSTEDCSKLSDALVLAVALTIDPNASSVSTPPGSSSVAPASVAEPGGRTPTGDVAAPEREPTRGSAAEPASPTPGQFSVRAPHEQTTLEARRPRQGPELQLSLRALLATGVLPRVAPGSALSGSLGTHALKVALGVAWFPESSTEDADFAFGLSAVSVGLCWEPVRTGRVFAGACADVEVGAMHAVVRRLTPLDSGDQLFVAGDIGPHVGLELGLGLRAELGALAVIPLLRPDFSVRGSNRDIFRSEQLGVTGFIGVGFRAPGAR